MPYLDKNYTKEVRQELRSRFPKFKFSVRTKNHSSLSVKIYSGPIDLLRDSSRGNESINQFYIDEHYEDFPEKRDFLNEVLSVMKREHNSCTFYDGDYGAVPNFYINLNIGSYDRPYQVKN